MASLEEIFDKGTGGNCDKWRHYLEIYETHLAKFQGKKCTYLEIGVQNGGSLEVMREYLGDEARIVGADIDPACTRMRDKGFEIFIGDQADVGFVNQIKEQVGTFDIIIDDGGHVADQQIFSFLWLFPHLNDGGIYIVEDMHTYFWEAKFQASRIGINFYDYAKGLIEKMSLWHLDPRLHARYRQPYAEREGAVQINNFATNTIFGIHFYDSVVVIQKRLRREPIAERK